MNESKAGTPNKKETDAAEPTEAVIRKSKRGAKSDVAPTAAAKAAKA